MRKRDGVVGVMVILLLALTMVVGMPAQSAQAQSIDSATLTLFVYGVSGETIDVHRITDSWTEMGVTWNNFGGAYDGAVEASFVADTYGLVSINVTALVQDWLDGSYPNYGLLLEQGLTEYTTFLSSEVSNVSLRPALEICYASGGCVTYQRQGSAQEGVADSYIWELNPDDNNGNSPLLWTGLLSDYEKQTLIWFDIERSCVSPRTPGYWKTHPEAWPVDSLDLGCETYTQRELLRFLWMPTRGDASVKFGHHLIAAKLNFLAGTDPTEVTDVVTNADELLCKYSGKLPYRVKPKSDDGKQMVNLKTALDAYNNGWLTPDCEP